MEIVFHNVTLRRGGLPVLDDVSFGTGERDFFMIYGASGSGKTSLLRLVNRLEDCSSGEVMVGGVPVRTYPPRELRRRVGMIFQEPRLFEGTVMENVLFAARHHGLETNPEELLESVGLEGSAGRDAASLSGGEQQRVAVARALAVNPEVLLMDEPTSSLDEAAALDIERLLVDLAARRSLKTLFVTHSRDQLLRLGGEGVLLEKGKVAARGSLLAETGGADV
jgi:putative ABC transport system ATP-binding protein